MSIYSIIVPNLTYLALIDCIMTDPDNPTEIFPVIHKGKRTYKNLSTIKLHTLFHVYIHSKSQFISHNQSTYLIFPMVICYEH